MYINFYKLNSCRLRISLSAAHSMADVDQLVAELRACGLPAGAAAEGALARGAGGLVSAPTSAIPGRHSPLWRAKL